MSTESTSLGSTKLRFLLPLLLAIGSLACSSCASHSPDVETPPGTEPPVEPPVTDDGGQVDAPTAADAEPVLPPPPPPPPSGARSTANVFFLGHSLQGWLAPSMLHDFAGASEVTYRYEAAIGIGANLAWQWEHPERAEGENPAIALRDRPFDLLVLTEAIPIQDQVRFADSVTNALRFIELAHAQNANVQVYLNETWDYRRTAEWRTQLGTDRAYYEQIVDGVNARYDGQDMLLIPGGHAMRALTDRILAGGVPGVTDVGSLFSDDIHLTELGWYFIACVQYAAIFQRSPVGVPIATTNRFDEPVTAPPAGAARVMQEIAWEVVSNEPRSGVN